MLTKDGRTIFAYMEIVAPALRSYSIEILRLNYTASELYPVSVGSRVSDREGEASTEDELREELREILTSNEVRSIISSLIAESQLSRQN